MVKALALVAPVLVLALFVLLHRVEVWALRSPAPRHPARRTRPHPPRRASEPMPEPSPAPHEEIDPTPLLRDPPPPPGYVDPLADSPTLEEPSAVGTRPEEPTEQVTTQAPPRTTSLP